MKSKIVVVLLAIGGAGALALAVAPRSSGAQQAVRPSDNVYTQKILVANRAGFDKDALIDPYMKNPWGIALRPPGQGGHIWISNAGSLSTSTFVGDVPGMPLRQDGLKIVFLKGPLYSYEDGLANVTGQVYNAASDFPDQPIEFPVSGPASNLTSDTAVPIGPSSGAAKFVFVTTDGTINAWRASTAESMNEAPIVKDYSDRGKDQIKGLRYLPAFTGVAMTVQPKGGNRLYVTDFQNGIIRVLDHTWTDITASVPFEKPKHMRGAWNPYNIQLLGDRLYVTFAEVNLQAEEAAFDMPGPGVGYLAAYDVNGKLLQEFGDAGKLNSPWGLAIAPDHFGPLSKMLLVANFGDGTIAAFDTKTGAFRDYLRGADGAPISIDGIWGLAFGNGVSLGRLDSLYFTAGPNLEQDGIFGALRHGR